MVWWGAGPGPGLLDKGVADAADDEREDSASPKAVAVSWVVVSEVVVLVG